MEVKGGVQEHEYHTDVYEHDVLVRISFSPALKEKLSKSVEGLEGSDLMFGQYHAPTENGAKYFKVKKRMEYAHGSWQHEGTIFRFQESRIDKRKHVLEPKIVHEVRWDPVFPSSISHQEVNVGRGTSKARPKPADRHADEQYNRLVRMDSNAAGRLRKLRRDGELVNQSWTQKVKDVARTGPFFPPRDEIHPEARVLLDVMKELYYNKDLGEEWISFDYLFHQATRRSEPNSTIMVPTNFIKNLYETFDAAIEYEQTYDPGAFYYKKPGDMYRSTYGLMKSPDTLPKWIYLSKVYWTNRKEFWQMLIAAHNNSRSLAEQEAKDAKNVSVKIKAWEIREETNVAGFQIDIPGDYEGARLEQGDKFTVVFQDGKAQGTTWNCTVHEDLLPQAKTTSVQALAAAGTKEYDVGMGNLKYKEKFIVSKVPSQFVTKKWMLDNGQEKLKEWLHDGDGDSATIEVQFPDKTWKEQSRALYTCNPFDTTRSDPHKPIANKFDKFLRGCEMNDFPTAEDMFPEEYKHYEAHPEELNDILRKAYDNPKFTLSKEQWEVLKSFNEKRQFCTVSGIAGSAKTTTEGIAAGLAVKSGKKVLILSPQNQVADRSCKSITPVIKAFKPDAVVYRGYALRQEVQNRPGFNKKLEAAQHVIHLSEIKRERNLTREEAKMQSAKGLEALEQVSLDGDVYFTTNFGVPHKHVQKIPFDVIIFTEGQRCTFLDICMALEKYPDAIIVISGDPRQINAIVLNVFRNRPAVIFEKSLLQLSIQRKYPTPQLTETFRATPYCCDFLSTVCYPGQVIESSISNTDREASKPFCAFCEEQLNYQTGAVVGFIDLHETTESKIGHTKSVVNVTAADHIMDIAGRLLEYGVKEEDIVILVPYAAQHALYVRCVRRLGRKFHVERFVDYIGGEGQIVLVDFVRTDLMGYLLTHGVILTALTRMMAGMIMFANHSNLEQSKDINKGRAKIYRDAVEFCRIRGTLIKLGFDPPPPITEEFRLELEDIYNEDQRVRQTVLNRETAGRNKPKSQKSGGKWGSTARDQDTHEGGGRGRGHGRGRGWSAMRGRRHPFLHRIEPEGADNPQASANQD